MKKLLFLFFLSPTWLIAQEVKNGSIIFDFHKKKPATDTIKQQQQSTDEDADTVVIKHHKEKKHTDTLQRTTSTYKGYDYKKDGIFYGLFHAGFNAAQIDGDDEYGYKYFGAEAGVGAMARFHKILSLSLELNYTMKGARSRLPQTSMNDERYEVQLDYIEAPIALNAHYKKWLVASIGIAPAGLVRYKETNYDGTPNINNPLGQPRKVDICGFGGLQFIIHEHYSLGGKFSYSMLKIRQALPNERVNGEYHNYLTFDFKYILGKVKKK